MNDVPRPEIQLHQDPSCARVADAQRIAVHEGHDPAPGGDIGAGTQVHVGDTPVYRSPYRGAFEVGLGEVSVRHRLAVWQLGFLVGRPNRPDPFLDAAAALGFREPAAARQVSEDVRSFLLMGLLMD